MNAPLNEIADLARTLIDYREAAQSMNQWRDLAAADRKRNPEQAADAMRKANELQAVCDDFEAERRQLSALLATHLPDVAKRWRVVRWPDGGRWDRRGMDWSRIEKALDDITVNATANQVQNDGLTANQRLTLAIQADPGRDWTATAMAKAAGVHTKSVYRLTAYKAYSNSTSKGRVPQGSKYDGVLEAEADDE